MCTKLIFDPSNWCRVCETLDAVLIQPLPLVGSGLWAGRIVSGSCVLEGPGPAPLTGQAGSLLLGRGEFRLVPASPCHVQAVQLAGQAALEFAGALAAPFFADERTAPRASELLAQLLALPPQDPAGCRLGFDLLCALSTADASADALPPLVAQALVQIRENYAGLYGVEELSQALGVSKSHLVRSFSAAVGVPPGQYLTQVRVEAAKQLLVHREYPLEVVASLCGFSGANYLCRVFKKQTGQTPAAWREKHSAPAPLGPLPLERELYI